MFLFFRQNLTLDHNSKYQVPQVFKFKVCCETGERSEEVYKFKTGTLNL